jgi:cation:H+ antiporter
VGLLMLTSGFLKECPKGLDEVAEILLLSSIIPLVLVVLEITNPIIGAGLLAVFIFSVYRETRTRSQILNSDLQNKGGEGKRKKSKILLKIIAGTAIIVVSAQFTVSSALEIAGLFGVIPLFIGARLVAIGTSLPELSLSLTAVKRGRMHLATANAIGSNLSNLTLILGIVFLSSAFSPFSVNIIAFVEIISFVLITSLIMWYHLTKGGDCRIIGVILILTYIAFQATAITE